VIHVIVVVVAVVTALSVSDFSSQHVAAMQQLSAKVFKLSFEYLHIYSPKSGDFCRKK